MNDVELMEKELSTRMAELANMEFGSKEYYDAVQAINVLTRNVTELKECDVEVKKIKTERNTNLIGTLSNVLLGAAGLVVTVWGAKATWEYEKEGVITSTPGKKFVSNLFNKK